MSYAARGALRSVKNVAKGYTDIQIKVREATSNDPGPINTELMRQIAAASHYDQPFVEIMIIMEKRLNDDGRKWRHVYKALVLLEFLLIAGSDRILQYAHDNFYVVKTLKEFQYRDEVGVDHGHNVRQKASKVSELLINPEALARERSSRRDVDNRVNGRTDYYSGRDSPFARTESPGHNRVDDQALAQREEEDIQRAIQESLKSSDNQYSSGNSRPGPSTTAISLPYSRPTDIGNNLTGGLSEEEQLQRAIELSKREHKYRRQGLGPSSNQSSPSSSSSPSPQSNPSKGQPLIDLLGGEDHSIIPNSGGIPHPNSFNGTTVALQPTGANDPFALPQGNPFSMLSSQPTGYTVATIPTGYHPGYSAPDPFGTTRIPTMATGSFIGNPTNPFNSAMSNNSTGISLQSTGWGNPSVVGSVGISNTGHSLNPFGTTPSSMATNTKSPMVDLDNIGPPNRNPFAMTHSTATSGSTSGGNFNWSNTFEPPKLSLAELAQQQQQLQQPQQHITGMNTGFSGVGNGSGFGSQPTGLSIGFQPTGQSFSFQPTGGMMQQPMVSQPNAPFGIQPTGSNHIPSSGTTAQNQTNPFF